MTGPDYPLLAVPGHELYQLAHIATFVADGLSRHRRAVSRRDRAERRTAARDVHAGRTALAAASGSPDATSGPLPRPLDAATYQAAEGLLAGNGQRRAQVVSLASLGRQGWAVIGFVPGIGRVGAEVTDHDLAGRCGGTCSHGRSRKSPPGRSRTIRCGSGRVVGEPPTTRPLSPPSTRPTSNINSSPATSGGSTTRLTRPSPTDFRASTSTYRKPGRRQPERPLLRRPRPVERIRCRGGCPARHPQHRLRRRRSPRRSITSKPSSSTGLGLSLRAHLPGQPLHLFRNKESSTTD